jgi:hypothetical protein
MISYLTRQLRINCLANLFFLSDVRISLDGGGASYAVELLNL